MEKYKSSYIKEEDLKVHVSSRTLGKFKTRIVEIEHIPTKTLVSAENESQLQAYKLAMKLLEGMVKPIIINSQF